MTNIRKSGSSWTSAGIAVFAAALLSLPSLATAQEESSLYSEVNVRKIQAAKTKTGSCLSFEAEFSEPVRNPQATIDIEILNGIRGVISKAVQFARQISPSKFAFEVDLTEEECRSVRRDANFVTVTIDDARTLDDRQVLPDSQKFQAR